MDKYYGSVSNYERGGPDHVCRPVLVDAQGRRTPLGQLATINGLQGYVVKAAEGDDDGYPKRKSVNTQVAPLLQYGYHVDDARKSNNNNMQHGRHGGGAQQPPAPYFATDLYNGVQSYGKYEQNAAAVGDGDDLFEKIKREVSSANYKNGGAWYNNNNYYGGGAQLPTAPYLGGRWETIDSDEAKRRYGAAAGGGGGGGGWIRAAPQREYHESIDSKEAAKKYGGVRFKF